MVFTTHMMRARAHWTNLWIKTRRLPPPLPIREVENWLAPGGGHGCRLKEGGGGLGNGHL